MLSAEIASVFCGVVVTFGAFGFFTFGAFTVGTATGTGAGAGGASSSLSELMSEDETELLPLAAGTKDPACHVTAGAAATGASGRI